MAPFFPEPPTRLRIACLCGGLDSGLVGRGVPAGRLSYACDECGAVKSLTTELALDWPRAAGR